MGERLKVILSQVNTYLVLAGVFIGRTEGNPEVAPPQPMSQPMSGPRSWGSVDVTDADTGRWPGAVGAVGAAGGGFLALPR